MVDMDDMDGMKLDYKNIGNIFNIKDKTDKYMNDLEKKIEKVKPLLASKSTRYAMVDGVPKTTEYWFYNDQFINKLLDGWGATNVFSEGKTQKAVLYDRVNQIDVLFEVCYGEVKYDNVLNHWKNDSTLKTAPAITKNQVYAVNLSIAYGADPTVMDVIDKLVEILK